MTGLLEKTAKRLAEYKGQRLAIGVSGGRDSVCLLHAVANCGEVRRSDILVVHINHGLRETAARDEAFVAGLCEKYGVAYRAVHVDVKAESASKGLTVEQAARELRYGAFYELVKTRAADIIITAHHALDNAESVLMHMFRGSGLDGLCGMAHSAVVRPFIDVYPAELDAYVQENKLEYVLDETNLIDDADRNFLRLNVMPLIEQRYPGAVRAINALADECTEIVAHLDGELDPGLIRDDGGAVLVLDAALTGPLAARYVRRALERFTLVDVTRQQIQNAVSLVHMRTGAISELAHGIKAAREYGCVAFYIPRESYGGEVVLERGANLIDGLAIDLTDTYADPKLLPGRVVDRDKLMGAVIRFRRDGDMFTPYGGCRKKLKRYFIDKKVPARVRDRMPLVCRGSEVLAIVGMELSDSVKVDAGTTHMAIIQKRW